MNKVTERLLDQVDAAHDWDLGQVWSGGGTQMSRTDHCRVCGLSRSWMTDPQNGVEDRFSFKESDELPLPLRDAAALQPCLDPTID